MGAAALALEFQQEGFAVIVRKPIDHILKRFERMHTPTMHSATVVVVVIEDIAGLGGFGNVKDAYDSEYALLGVYNQPVQAVT